MRKRYVQWVEQTARGVVLERRSLEESAGVATATAFRAFKSPERISSKTAALLADAEIRGALLRMLAGEPMYQGANVVRCRDCDGMLLREEPRKGRWRCPSGCSVLEDPEFRKRRLALRR